jgi:ribokinase
MKVVGLGQCSLDYIFVVDVFPKPDTKKEVLQWTVCGGGPVATALVSLSRLGVNCSFCGIIGDDRSGKIIEASLREENVDIEALIKRPGSHSQTAFISVEQGSGKRTICWKRPSGNPLLPEELPNDFLENANFLLLDGLMTDASQDAAEQARAQKIPVMLDAGRMREGMQMLAAQSDYLVASEEFGKEMVQERGEHLQKEEEALSRMKDLGPAVCTITLGERGNVTLSDGEVFHVPAFPVDVIDTTGAGDVFHGGYIYGLLQGWGIKRTVYFASAFASLKCRRLGGREGIPSLEEVSELLKDSDL